MTKRILIIEDETPMRTALTDLLAGEGYRASQGEEVSGTDADEEVLQGGSGRGGEEKQAGEGEKGSDGGGPAWRRCVGGSKGRDDGEERDEDDDQAGDEGGFCGSGASKSGRLELIAGCEEDADDQAGEERVTVDMAELSMIHDGESDECEGHAEQVE